jgi:hypothetical protein
MAIDTTQATASEQITQPPVPFADKLDLAAPVATVDPLTTVKAVLEVMSPALNEGAPEQLAAMFGKDLQGMPAHLVKEVLQHRLTTDPKLAHFVKPAPPKFAPGSVEEYAARHAQVNGRTPGIGLGGFATDTSAIRAGQRVNPSSGFRTPAAPTQVPPITETYEQMKARMAAVRGGSPQFGFLGGSTGLGGGLGGKPSK